MSIALLSLCTHLLTRLFKHNRPLFHNHLVFVFHKSVLISDDKNFWAITIFWKFPSLDVALSKLIYVLSFNNRNFLPLYSSLRASVYFAQ
jgi:hypothetical protein